MKRILASLLAVLMIFSVGSTLVLAEDEISVLVDGVKVNFDVAPVISEGRTLVPVRAVFEALGAEVDWKKEESRVVSKKGDTEVTLTVNEKVLVKNGEEITLDVPATITDGRTLVPVRAISEAYGCDVSWNEAKRTVVVISDINTVEAMNVNGESVPVFYYKMWLDNAAQSAAGSIGGTVSDVIKMWDASIGEFSLGNQIKEMAVSEIKARKIMCAEAVKRGITLTEEKVKNIDALVVGMFASEEAEKIGMSPESLRKQLEEVEYVNAYSEALIADYAVNTKEVKEHLDKNYVRAKHILITPEADENGEITEEARKNAKKSAEEILLKAKRGADFDMLIKEFGKDPGQEANPGGYLFTKGEMVEPFEKAAFELGVNKISGVVETTYGYHIIKRVKSDYSDEEIESFKERLSQERANAEFEKIYNAATVTFNEALIDVILPSAN